MDSLNRFTCTMMHPGLFPPVITDPFNPLRVKLTAEVSADKLSFISSPLWGEPKIIGSEPYAKLGDVMVEHLSVNAQRFKILQKSILRMACVTAVGFLYFLFFRTYGPGYSLLIGLAGAAVSGPLFFLFNGGFTITEDVVRFHFRSHNGGKAFYLEVEPANENEIKRALLAAGLKFPAQAGGQEA